ncbi:hypothetical protein BgAZ_302810 [Babesia gibsoni]|uniref:Prefoldin subunit n=1 Tax=Babesia gibsoni TaxID=33632 RepID=A0AAD8LNM0_BABGI|nr:hypothetical protein BgAZ_302810 [Babesia gibsoni]
MSDNDGTLANEDVLGVLREQLPPELQGAESVEEVLGYGISRVKAERDAAIGEYLNTKKLMTDIKLLRVAKCGTRAYIDAGNSVFLPAKLKGKRLFINIGYQFHVEMEPDEAAEFCAERLKLIKRNIDALNRKLAQKRAEAFIIEETLVRMASLM